MARHSLFNPPDVGRSWKRIVVNVPKAGGRQNERKNGQSLRHESDMSWSRAELKTAVGRDLATIGLMSTTIGGGTPEPQRARIDSSS
jgi:hypothetical protein